MTAFRVVGVFCCCTIIKSWANYSAAVSKLSELIVDVPTVLDKYSFRLIGSKYFTKASPRLFSGVKNICFIVPKNL